MSRIHSYSEDDLFKAALDHSLPADQQVLIVAHLAKTERFKRLPPQDRISFFTDACSRVSEEIATTRNQVIHLKNLQETQADPSISITEFLLSRIDTVQSKAFEQADRLN